MAIRIRSLSGLGSLGATGGVAAMKAALNALDRQTGNTGRFNAGAEDQNLSGDAGWYVVKATANLLVDAAKAPADVANLAAALIGSISKTAGNAVGDLSEAVAVPIRIAMSQASSILKYLTGDVAYALWQADRITGKHLAGYLADASGHIAKLAGAYLAVLKTGAASGPAPASPTAPTSSTPDSGHTFRIDRPEFRVASHAVTSGQQVVFNEDTTPIRPSLAKPTLVIGGAVAVAAAILLLR